jgi:hypothetical protein
MIVVRMVQVAVDEIVNVIPMHHRLMVAPGSVNVARIAAAQPTLIAVNRTYREQEMTPILAGAAS